MEQSKLTTAAVAAFAAFVVLYAVSEADQEMPLVVAAMRASAAIAAPLAVCLAVRTVGSVWRGPVLVRFPRTEAMACDGDSAARVRAAAQLRGSLGGAGHVHRGRLALPVGAWVLAATVAGAALEGKGAEIAWASLPLALVLLGCLLLPARPFWYREARDGSVLVHPPAACARLLRERDAVGEAICGHDANGG